MISTDHLRSVVGSGVTRGGGGGGRGPWPSHPGRISDGVKWRTNDWLHDSLSQSTESQAYPFAKTCDLIQTGLI